MRPSFLLVSLTFLACSCSDTGQGKVQSTDTSKPHLPSATILDTKSKADTGTINKTEFSLDTLPNISLNKMTLVSSGQMSPYSTIQIDGYSFSLVARDSDTIYLSTTDQRFQTPEGYKTGTKFSELPKDIQDNLTKETGWGYYFKLPSGWTLGFCEGKSCTDKYPGSSSNVNWIFKRP